MARAIRRTKSSIFPFMVTNRLILPLQRLILGHILIPTALFRATRGVTTHVPPELCLPGAPRVMRNDESTNRIFKKQIF